MTDQRPAGRYFPWGAHADRDRPARETLTREQIVEAAIRVLDEEGLDALSMRRLGKELGAGTTSVYWHVRNKDELLDLVVDRIIGDVLGEAGPLDRSWRDSLEQMCHALRTVLLRHRGIAAIMGERPAMGPNALGALERLLGIFAEAGFEPREAILASTTLVNWVSGFAVFEVRDPLGPSATDADREAFMGEFFAFAASLPPGQFPNFVSTIPIAAALTPDEQFQYALDVMLDGIELRARRRRAGGVA